MYTEIRWNPDWQEWQYLHREGRDAYWTALNPEANWSLLDWTEAIVDAQQAFGLPVWLQAYVAKAPA